ncbi:MAG: sodium:solute symporter family protein [Candidatus Thermoplasmatota archaeon]|nr:sodium:solute symporter family protein [Candidatus Thermoplasmatota archaeon]
MDIALVIFCSYLLLLLAIGVYSHIKSKRTTEDYFLASRSIGPLVLFFSLAATNFSAFTFFGFAGASYKIGFAYYGIMAFGTGFMAVSFYFIGRKLWKLGKQKGYITPPELIGDRMGSTTLRLMFMAVMVVFTIPYLATQAVGGGIALTQLTNGLVSYEGGAAIITLVILVYVLFGGMRGDAYTDVLQGIVMLVTIISAVGIVSWGLGGFTFANTQIAERFPDLMTRPGGGGFFTVKVWISYMLLWTLADPMFPQLWTRFYAARDEKAIRTSMVLYPIVTMALFLGPVLIGVWGNLTFPGLIGSGPDSILPMMVAEYAPAWAAGAIMAGAFAALMSTADSQLLVLSSMLTRDVYGVWLRKGSSDREQYIAGKVFVVGLALSGLAIALFRVEAIFDILTRTTFTGLAVLFPTTIAALYWKRATKWGCISSIAIGELTYAGFYFGWIPDAFSFGFLPVVPVSVVAAGVLIIASLLTKRRD